MPAIKSPRIREIILASITLLGILLTGCSGTLTSDHPTASTTTPRLDAGVILEQNGVAGIGAATPQVLVDGHGGGWVAWARQRELNREPEVMLSRLKPDGQWTLPAIIGRGDLVQLLPAKDSQVWVAWRQGMGCAVRRLDDTNTVLESREFSDFFSESKIHFRGNARGDIVLAAQKESTLRVVWNVGGVWSPPATCIWPELSGFRAYSTAASALDDKARLHILARYCPEGAITSIEETRIMYGSVTRSGSIDGRLLPEPTWDSEVASMADGCVVVSRHWPSHRLATQTWSAATGWSTMTPIAEASSNTNCFELIPHGPSGRSALLANHSSGLLGMAKCLQDAFGPLAPICNSECFPVLAAAMNEKGDLLTVQVADEKGSIIFGRSLSGGAWERLDTAFRMVRSPSLAGASLDAQGRGIIAIQYHLGTDSSCLAALALR